MPPPPSIIRAEIDSAFNALLLEAFFCGLYTLLFAYVLRSLLHTKNKKLYAAALTLLWILVMLTFSLDWQYRRTAFVLHNNSSIDIASGVVGPNSIKSLSILDNTLSISCNWLADAMLIWRCYILWEDKKWVLLPLPVLLLADIVLGLIAPISAVTSAIKKDADIFLVSFFAVSIVITFTGTFLIILRILLVTGRSPLTTHTSVYRNIQRILVESGIIYTIAMFVTGVVLFIQITAHTGPSIPAGELATYSVALLVPFSGIGPTLIAVRVGGDTPTQTNASASGTRSRFGVLSHLTFRRVVRQNESDTFDISTEDGFAHGDGAFDSSVVLEGHSGHNEKM